MEWSEETVKHLQDHIDPMLPAKGSEILAACNDMEDVPDEDKEAVKANIDPEKLYEDIDAVMADLNAPASMEEEAM
jgi:hypothetical protein